VRPPRHLWRGDWRTDSQRAADAAEEQAAALRRAPHHGTPPGAAPQEDPPSERSAASYRKIAIAGVCAGVLGLAFAGGLLVADDNGPDPLPAVSKAPLKPGKGKTQASAVYAAASPAVVSVRTTGGAGTGFLIDGAKIVTNAHVVENSTRVTVRFGEDESHAADVLGTDPSSDLAVLSIDNDDLPKDVKPLRFADSRSVSVGDPAIAIGNPFGLDRTATEGIVSGIGRHIAAPNGFSIDEVIQTDAPINPGNSGGPLLDGSGAVIGVNAQIATGGTQGNIGIGFAVPSNTAREVVPRLAKGEEITRAYLGLETSPASPGGDVGAQVQRAVPGGPGERAGLKVGDVILKLDGKDVNEPADVSGAIADKRPGDRVEVEVERDGRLTKVDVTLGKRPAKTP
jgi:putative serine protease PepD